jgi:hypothetical protein
MRFGEWLQEIDHLNIFVHALKNDNEPTTSLQQDHNGCN